MRDDGNNIDNVKEVVNNPRYTKPILPQPDREELVMPILRYNSNADANTFLRSLPATMPFPYRMRGNINPEDIQETPYMDKVTSWYSEHPNSQLYGFKDLNSDRYTDAIPINPDLSNYRRSYSLVTDEDLYRAQRYNRSLQTSKGIPHNVHYTQADVSTPVEAGKYIADYNRLKNAMSDWKRALRDSPYLDSFYDPANQNDNSYKLWSRDKDAKVMAQALSDCNGDVEKAFEKIAEGVYDVSDGAYDAIVKMTGFDVDTREGKYDRTDPRDVWRLKGQSAQRFFNAYNAARNNYDIDGSRPSSDAYYGYDKEKYDDYMKRQAARDIVLRNTGQNIYARGGRLRTPNTIRSRNGLKMRRAEDLGGTDYDIYF